MNITILGCGYVGTALTNHWRNTTKHTITATTTTPERLDELGAIAHRSLLVHGSNADALNQGLKDQDVLVVTLAPTGNQLVETEDYERTYLATCKNLVKVVPEAANIKQIIYTGSCSVYGNANGDWVDETTPPSPGDRYGEILHESEKILLSARLNHASLCLFRLGAIYGPGRDLKSRFEKLAGKTRPGTGENYTNWVHLDDIVAAIDFALKHQLQGIYNLVSSVPMKSRDLTEQICQKYSFAPLEWDPAQAKSRSNNRRVSNQKLQQQGYNILHPNIEF